MSANTELVEDRPDIRRSVPVPKGMSRLELQCAPRCLMVPPTSFNREKASDEVGVFVHDEKHVPDKTVRFQL